VRFTTPAKNFLSPILEPLGGENPLTRAKRGFNPPLGEWLRTDLALRLGGLGQRLQDVTSSQVSGRAVDAYVNAWTNGENRLAEQVLQLVLLDESLAQLAKLAREDQSS
jgi:asparagine synthase (glutamine-hydrolysing)